MLTKSMTNYIAKMEKKDPELLKQEHLAFTARAGRAIEDLAVKHGVKMTMNPQTGDVVFHERLMEGEFAYLRKEANKVISDEVAMMMARMKIQEIIYENMGGRYDPRASRRI